MQFSSTQCSTEYAVPDDKVRGKRIRTKCRKCGAEIVVDGPGARASIPPASRGPASAGSAPLRPPQPSLSSVDDERWTVAIDRATQKKMTGAEIVEAFGRQEVGEETLVWKQGMEDWKQLFDVPVIALALRGKGYEPGKAPAPVGAPQKAPAGAWDDENEATRVVDGAIQFPARMSPGARPLPAPAPVPAARPLPAPAPVPAARPSAAKAPPPGAGFDDEDEATRVVAGHEAKDLLAPLSAQKPPAPLPPKPAAPQKFARTQLGLAAPPPPAPAAPKTQPVPEAPPAAPPTSRSPASAPSSMDFDDEATAIIAPDRAKELLDEEARKSQRRPEPPAAPGPLAETPMGFGFDDEATLVVAPEKAGQLLKEKKPAVEVAPPRPPEPAVKAPEPPPPSKPAIPTPTPAAGRPAIEDPRKSRPGSAEGGPSVVLTEPKDVPGKAQPEAAPSLRDLSGISHEPTRVVRVKKKSSGTLFWVTLIIALTAAAVGGFVASRLVDGQSLPGWMRLH